MAEVVILDAEALAAIAFARERGAASARVRAVLALAHEVGAPVRVPAPVLSEVCRGDGRDNSVLRVLGGGAIRVIDLDARIARRAAALLTRSRLDSRHAIDAFVVATAVELGGALIATHDPDDLRRLAANQKGISVVRI